MRERRGGGGRRGSDWRRGQRQTETEENERGEKREKRLGGVGGGLGE